MVDRLGAMRGPGESYSDVILRPGGGRTSPARPPASPTREGGGEKPLLKAKGFFLKN
jgi:hypothetical protein